MAHGFSCEFQHRKNLEKALMWNFARNFSTNNCQLIEFLAKYLFSQVLVEDIIYNVNGFWQKIVRKSRENSAEYRRLQAEAGLLHPPQTALEYPPSSIH